VGPISKETLRSVLVPTDTHHVLKFCSEVPRNRLEKRKQHLQNRYRRLWLSPSRRPISESTVILARCLLSMLKIHVLVSACVLPQTQLEELTTLLTAEMPICFDPIPSNPSNVISDPSTNPSPEYTHPMNISTQQKTTQHNQYSSGSCDAKNKHVREISIM